MAHVLGEFFFGGSAHRKPRTPIPTEARAAADFARAPSSGLRVTWLGHSTTLLEIDGARLLFDPVWSDRISPFPFAGPKRFFAPPLPLDELPDVDVVVLSHDHYDHLDAAFVRAVAERIERWVMPLGVGRYLRRWGVTPSRIEELDWWDKARVRDLTLTATPARHFSGRGFGGRDRTLWSGWAIAGPAHNVYYAGDTAMQREFADVGARLGPFDLTMIEVGAYDAHWPDVHIGPEQALRAHQQVRGGALLPLHWGTFDLALHGWTEPMERLLAGAQRQGVCVLAPRPGQMVEPGHAGSVERWWPDLPWRTADEAPITSTGLESNAAVQLRDIHDSDLDSFFDHQADAEAAAMAAFRPRDREAFLTHWARVREDPANSTWTILVAGDVAGYVACFPLDDVLNVACWIGRPFWGRGVATAALAQLLGKVPTRPLFARAAEHNVGSRRVLEKCGFVHIETISPGTDDDVTELLFRID